MNLNMPQNICNQLNPGSFNCSSAQTVHCIPSFLKANLEAGSGVLETHHY